MSTARGPKVRVLIVDDVADTRENIKKLLLFESDIEVVGAAADGSQAIEAAKQLQPDVVLMDINMPGIDGITAAEAIGGSVPQSQVIMMSVQGEADYLRRSMLAGAREFLIKPFTGDELVEGIRRVYALGTARRQSAPPPVQQVVPAQVTSQPAPPPEGKIIAVFSPKGGTGKTTVAANVALALKAETGKRVVLVDASMQFGDVGVVLNLEGKKSIADAVGSGGEMEPELLDAVLQAHPSGIRVLLAPSSPELADLITPDAVKKVLQRLKAGNDFVVVDTCATLHEPTLSVLDVSDRILLILNSELTTVKNTRLFLEAAEQLGYLPEKMVLVLNRTDARSGISSQDISRSIGHPIAVSVVSDSPVASTAINRGVPFVVSQKDSQISRDMREVAHIVAGWTAGARAKQPADSSGRKGGEGPAKKGLWAWLTGK